MDENNINRLKTLDNSLPITRQVRFREFTCSFYIWNKESIGIGEELIELVRLNKKLLESSLCTLSLPKIVRIGIWDTNLFASDSVGTFGGVLP